MGWRVGQEKGERIPLVLVYLIQNILHVAPVYVVLVNFAKKLLIGVKSKACTAYFHCCGFA